MAKLTFLYELVGSSKFGPIYLPIAKVKFKHKDGWLAVWLIAVTGADKALLPCYLSQQLNISLEKDCF